VSFNVKIFEQCRLTQLVLTQLFEEPMILSNGGYMKLKVVLEPSDEGGFTVYVPSLPGCVSEGESESDALQNIRKAIELYLEPVDDDLAGAGKDVREIVL
jgi:predicted RNase H-like HicB family nuclease